MMRNTICLLTVIILISNSCYRNKQDNSTLEDANSEFENYQVTQSNDQFNKSLWLIKNNCIGVIKTNSKIDSSIAEIKKYFEVSPDSIDLTNSGYGDGIQYFYNINLYDNLMFIIHPDAALQRILTIEVVNNIFTTDKGFKIGSNYGELRSLYQIKSSSYNFDDGLFVFAKDFDGTFRLKTGELETYQIDSIPQNIAIDRIIIY